MEFTVVKLFNHKSYGLDAPHYAVLAEMPENMGGHRRVVDLVAESEMESPEALCAAFSAVKSKMPHRVHDDGGGEIDFFGTDSKGCEFSQGTAHIPAKPVVGAGFEQSLLDNLAWRARASLWLESKKPAALTQEKETRILETARTQPPLNMAAEKLALYETARVVLPPAEETSPPLTARPPSL